MKRFCFSVLFFVIGSFSHANSISIVTNQWTPYINAQHQPIGTAAELLSQIVSQENQTIEWRYQNYDLAFELIASGKQEAGFPYFKTEERSKRVLFSDAIFSVKNRIYFNRQRENSFELDNLDGYRFGVVSGYSYGQMIDNLITERVTFVNEKQALESLLKNEIDFLPMTESVMNTLLNNDYQDQALLIKYVEGIKETDSMHLITPKDKNGEALIHLINRLLKQVSTISSLKLKSVDRYIPKDIAVLTTAEGYPVIIGQTSKTDSALFYTLPKGTKVLVLEWSNEILTPSSTDRIYKNMMASSHVLVLNGPHVGKELFIKNMHLEIK